MRSRFHFSSLMIECSRGIYHKRKYTGEDLPAFSQSTTYDDFALDAQAVVDAIRDELNRA